MNFRPDSKNSKKLNIYTTFVNLDMNLAEKLDLKIFKRNSLEDIEMKLTDFQSSRF